MHKKVTVNDLMQKNYVYYLTSSEGKDLIQDLSLN